jgi:carboxymethylenebutenolidase
LVKRRKRHPRHHVDIDTGPQSANACHGFHGSRRFLSGLWPGGHFEKGLLPYAPVRLFVGAADNEIDPQKCELLVNKSFAAQADTALKLYADATHDFDDPGVSHQSIPANAAATRDATADA